jgi:two-component system response regulator FixJ
MPLAATRDVAVLERPTEAVVAIVDDDLSVRVSTADLLESESYRVLAFASGDAFLGARLPDNLACILLDMRMPGRSGLDILRAMSERTVRPPTLILSGHPDLEMAVAAMKLGAVDFLQKPCPPRTLLRAVAELTALAERSRERSSAHREMSHLVDALSKRQRQILDGIVRGHPNKTIARDLQLSVRTVESYRADLFKRLGVRTIAEAVRIGLAAGI